MTSAISSLPSVKVPVLSKRISFILDNSSTYSPPLIIIPFLVPFVIATGVEITRAHGHAITKSVNALYVQSAIDPPIKNGGRIATSRAKTTTIGV